MGTRTKFQGQTALSFAVWVVEMKWFFDVAIQEITPLFQTEVFGELLKNWTVQTQVLCPSKCGLPYSRQRKYSVLMRIETLFSVPAMDATLFYDAPPAE
ncbi:unnamed protein product, partial [Symbiodinium sp. CCMP2592]